MTLKLYANTTALDKFLRGIQNDLPASSRPSIFTTEITIDVDDYEVISAADEGGSFIIMKKPTVV